MYSFIHTLHCIILHYITLITLHYVTLQYITLCYITVHYIMLHYITFLHICMYEYTSHLGFEIYNCCMVFSNETYILCTLSYDFISATKKIVVRFEWQHDTGDNNLCLFKRLVARSRQKWIHCVFNICVINT
jgi:hypothetical protein